MGGRINMHIWPNDTAFAACVKSHLVNKKITLNEIAALCGVTRQSMQKYLSDKEPPAKVMRKAIKNFGCDAYEMLGVEKTSTSMIEKINNLKSFGDIVNINTATNEITIKIKNQAIIRYLQTDQDLDEEFRGLMAFSKNHKLSEKYKNILNELKEDNLKMLEDEIADAGRAGEAKQV